MPTPGLPAPSIRFAVLALAVGLVACSGGSDPEKQLETLQSWQSTVSLTTDAVHRGWTPRRYGKQLRDRANAALNESRASPPKDAPPSALAELRRAERDLAERIDTLTRAVGP